MKDIISLSPQEAYTLLQTDAHAKLIDIRSSMEFLFVGHAVGAIHIAWIDEPDWEINPDFVAEVSRTIKGEDSMNRLDTPIVLICRSGQRTLQAAKVLIESGFTHVIHVDEGFEGARDNDFHRSAVGGWRYNGLPWEQC
ncbi:MAG: rhodanese-like domain-containing protein [Cocleimonas sp.]|nr:rhodanese-like domain-containing protein [Cocleimonas sp.]